jgi:DNA-binding IclR family transcriptional regulator
MNHSQGQNICTMVAALVLSDRTSSDLVRETGADKKTIARNLHHLKRAGLVYRRKLATERELRDDGTYSCGPFPVVWAWQPRPFACRDFERGAA